jgi:SAM-dependent methyltransferase
MAATQVHQPDCIACGTATREIAVGPSYFDECRACGLSRLRGYNGRSDYWDAKQARDPYWTDARRRYFRAALRRFPGGRMLDVGGGIGEFTRLALEMGFDAYSLDSSDGATGAAARTLGGRALAAAPEAGSFDVVTLWCVIAHVSDPCSLLQSARSWLRPGGMLWLTTPNFAFQKRYGKILASAGRPIDFAAEDHIWHFTQQSLTLLFARAGFAPPRFHYVGGTDRCTALANGSTIATQNVLIWGKRAWNRTAARANKIRVGIPTSELQVVTHRH